VKLARFRGHFPSHYTPEFRRTVMELIRSGKSADVVARELSISRNTITNWLKHIISTRAAARNG